MYIGLYVKYPLFSLDFNETCIFSTDLRKTLKYQIENPSSGSRVVPCGRTDRQTDRKTDMTKLIVALRNFANAPNKKLCCRGVVLIIIIIIIDNTMGYQT
jgi:hypothetical protein